MALAYFITFTTYGTWLHGAAKGKGSVDAEHNEFGSPFVAPNAELVRQEREAMTQPAYIMGEAEREIVCQAIQELAIDRAWNLLAVQVRTNHVHVVLQADRTPERVMSDIKGRASRNLTRAGYDDSERKRWTRHGSTRHLFREEQVWRPIRYTLDEQGARMAWYAKEEPRKEP